MIRSEQFNHVTNALFAAKAIINTLPLVKDKQGDKAKYLQLETLLAAIEPVLLSQQLMLVQGVVGKYEDGVLASITMRTTLLHITGEWIATDVVIPVAGPIKAKTDGGGRGPVGAQDGGISNTYARRYGILTILSISVDQDTDGAAKNQERRGRAKKAASNIIEETQRRTEELKGKVGKLVKIDECHDCKRKKGQPHAEGCPNA